MPNWLGLAQLRIDATRRSIQVDQAPPSTFVGGIKRTDRDNTAEPLVKEPTLCRSVWIGVPANERGRAINKFPVYIGDAKDQNMALLMTNYQGFVIPIDDASKIHVRAPAAGEQVVYRIHGDTQP